MHMTAVTAPVSSPRHLDLRIVAKIFLGGDVVLSPLVAKMSLAGVVNCGRVINFRAGESGTGVDGTRSALDGRLHGEGSVVTCWSTQSIDRSTLSDSRVAD